MRTYKVAPGAHNGYIERCLDTSCSVNEVGLAEREEQLCAHRVMIVTKQILEIFKSPDDAFFNKVQQE